MINLKSDLLKVPRERLSLPSYKRGRNGQNTQQKSNRHTINNLHSLIGLRLDEDVQTNVSSIII